MNAEISAPDRLDALARTLNDALPQTQCTRCGYPDCAAYAEAIARDGAAINQCPPGGAEGIDRLAAITGRAALPLNPVNGIEAPRLLAVIDEAWCIGCTLCLKACPTDAILGGSKAMHTVIDAECTGCELCLPACPVDCISLVPITGERTGWQAWSTAQAQVARERYEWHRERLQRESEAQTQPDPAPANGKQSVIEAALARARATRRV
jgi:Na+-translocating ferredoxin:NAD+ oxidoreductase subunit B